MKKIKLNETQLYVLIETASSSVMGFTNGDVKEYQGSEINTVSNVTSPDGELEYGEPVNTDDVQKTLAIQNFWANGRRGTRAM